MMNKNDYAIGALIGFAAGICAMPVLLNLGIRNYAILLSAPWVVAGVVAFGVWLGNYLSRFLPIFSQLSRFAAVGILNTALDFGTLNLLSKISGATAGLKIGGYNVPGVAVAIANSYFWNKYWVFKSGRTGFSADAAFLTITISGLLLNSLIVGAVTSFFVPPGGLSPQAWLNVVKLFTTAFNLTWNFVGYKFFVFTPANPTEAEQETDQISKPM